MRLLVGGVTHNSARLRLDRDVSTVDTPFDPAGLAIEPSDANVACTVNSDTSVASTIIDITGLTPNTTYSAQVSGTTSDRAVFRTAPASVTANESLLLAFASCYFPSDNFIHNPQIILDVLAKRTPSVPAQPPVATLAGFFPFATTAEKLPHAMVHCGDQVYGDVPMGGGDDNYGVKYRDYWRDGQWGGVFRVGGHYFVPDDHEYWNNYPDKQLWLQRSWGYAWKDTAKKSLNEFWRHQGVWNFPPGSGQRATGNGQREFWNCVGLGDIDMFIADARSQRTSFDGDRRPGSSAQDTTKRAFMGSAQLRAIVDWTKSVQRAGIIVFGQPLIMFPGGGTDYILRDYTEQYTELMAALWRAVDQRGVSIIVLTGDIHWGRLMQFRSPRTDASLIEYIASPVGRLSNMSALSTHYDGGPRAMPGSWKNGEGYSDSEMKLVEKHLPGAVTQKHFATWENHVGILELIERSGRLTAVCQSWSLQTREIAFNEWAAPPFDLCSAEVSL